MAEQWRAVGQLLAALAINISPCSWHPNTPTEMTRKLDFSSLALSSQWTCFHFHFSASKWLFLAKLLVTVFVQTKICYSSLLDKKGNKFFLQQNLTNETSYMVLKIILQFHPQHHKSSPHLHSSLSIIYWLFGWLCDRFLSLFLSLKLTDLDFPWIKSQDVCCISLLIDG